MRIIIADDETWVRTTIKNMLLELDMHLDIVGEASNGEELIEMSQLHQPQLAFIDIRMPTIDGLEAIRVAKELSPQTRWVILSGSSDFKYAQEAIRLGVKNYLLKPVDPQSLSRCVEEISEDYNHDLVKGNDEFEFLISSFVWGNRTLQDLSGIQSYQFSGILICIDSSLSESLKLQLIQTWLKEIQTHMKRTMNHKDIRYAKITLRNGDYAIITAWSPSHHAIMLSIRSELVHFIKSKMIEYKTDYFSLTALQSDISNDLETCIHQISSLQYSSPLRTVLPHSGVWSRKDLAFYQNNDQPIVEISRTAEKAVRFYQSNEYLFYKKEIDTLERQLASLPLHQIKTIHALCEYFNTTIKRAFDPNCHSKIWIEKLREFGEKLLPTSANKDLANQDLINQVIRHIEQHYMDDISINQLATQFNITPNYLSTLFSKRCGVTFSRYITQIRMHKAKEILIEKTTMKIQEIANQLGYYSSSHFIKTFSEFHGSSPSQFREQHLDK
ncbi:helix-turn-helix domain-containing protein [Paenibacillus alginolyticus]|nr:helix-turn-helix domain-containing protein [Paenibacillus alginolyticus]MCY9668375.1 helix-turn-helix domain-containing protein [Paenibacillus alginolyticus]